MLNKIIDGIGWVLELIFAVAGAAYLLCICSIPFLLIVAFISYLCSPRKP